MDKKKEEFLRKLGLNISKIRKQKGYSQDKVCLEGGFSRGTLSKIENGSVSAEAYTLYRIAETIGVPLKRLTELDR